jgi:hypothetical protein
MDTISIGKLRGLRSVLPRAASPLWRSIIATIYAMPFTRIHRYLPAMPR